MSVDLDQIAAEEKVKIRPVHPCWVCSIPNQEHREWVDRVLREGMSITVVTNTLIAAKYPKELATRSRVKSHRALHLK
jgi:hypothetical protein